jgi:hypothetical protein
MRTPETGGRDPAATRWLQRLVGGDGQNLQGRAPVRRDDQACEGFSSRSTRCGVKKVTPCGVRWAENFSSTSRYSSGDSEWLLCVTRIMRASNCAKLSNWLRVLKKRSSLSDSRPTSTARHTAAKAASAHDLLVVEEAHDLVQIPGKHRLRYPGQSTRFEHAGDFAQCLVHVLGRHMMQRLEHDHDVEGIVLRRDRLGATLRKADVGQVSHLQVAGVLDGIDLQRQDFRDAFRSRPAVGSSPPCRSPVRARGRRRRAGSSSISFTSLTSVVCVGSAIFMSIPQPKRQRPTLSNSTSKVSVAFGGTAEPAPRAP